MSSLALAKGRAGRYLGPCVVRAAPARHLRFVFSSGWETFFHDVVRTTGGAAPDPAMLAELAKQGDITLLVSVSRLPGEWLTS